MNSTSFNLESIILITLSAVLWGSTDACMKYCCPTQTKDSKTLLSQFLSLLCTPSYLLCLILNQFGSVLYYYSLSFAPLSLVNPVVNTGKVFVNILVGRVLGEKTLTLKKKVGLMFLLTGIVLQITA